MQDLKDCEAMKERLVELAWDEIAEPALAHTLAHLETCDHCRKELGQIRNLRTLVRSIRTLDVPVGLEARVMSEARQAMQSRAPLPEPVVGKPRPSWWMALLLGPGLMRPAIVAAMTVALLAGTALLIADRRGGVVERYGKPDEHSQGLPVSAVPAAPPDSTPTATATGSAAEVPSPAGGQTLKEPGQPGAGVAASDGQTPQQIAAGAEKPADLEPRLKDEAHKENSTGAYFAAPTEKASKTEAGGGAPGKSDLQSLLKGSAPSAGTTVSKEGAGVTADDTPKGKAGFLDEDQGETKTVAAKEAIEEVAADEEAQEPSVAGAAMAGSGKSETKPATSPSAPTPKPAPPTPTAAPAPTLAPAPSAPTPGTYSSALGSQAAAAQQPAGPASPKPAEAKAPPKPSAPPPEASADSMSMEVEKAPEGGKKGKKGKKSGGDAAGSVAPSSPSPPAPPPAKTPAPAPADPFDTAMSLEKAKDWDGAAKILKGLKDNPSATTASPAKILHHLAQCTAKAGETKKALVYYENLFAKHSGYPGKHAAMWDAASLYLEIGDTAGARTLLEQLLEVPAWSDKARKKLDHL